MDYNFWDDRTYELYEENDLHPCYGCVDFMDGECISSGACADKNSEEC